MQILLISTLITIAFTLIFCWSKFDDKVQAQQAFTEYAIYFSKKLNWKNRLQAKSQIPEKEEKPAKLENGTNDFAIEEHSNKIGENVIIRGSVSVSMPEDEDGFARDYENEEQFQKLIQLARRAKAIPRSSSSGKRNRPEKSKNQPMFYQDLTPQMRMKLMRLESDLKKKKKGRILEPIEELTLSRDSFSSRS